jgi:hypothetical protein
MVFALLFMIFCMNVYKIQNKTDNLKKRIIRLEEKQNSMRLWTLEMSESHNLLWREWFMTDPNNENVVSAYVRTCGGCHRKRTGKQYVR